MPWPIWYMRRALDTSVAWWVFDFVSNYINVKYSLMHPLVVEKQDALETDFIHKDAEACRCRFLHHVFCGSL